MINVRGAVAVWSKPGTNVFLEIIIFFDYGTIEIIVLL
ncbi:hypothetical protein Clst_1612 [Thermoclostridium stercorarium subsp. stercorarium DSM 8532]|jgi:hypothetical protein|nr:hypothetical protein Clst_1612 [Thermoclostridium stercorarium subsp. stercorarium DSM 8532]